MKINKQHLESASRTLLSDQELAHYFEVEIEEIREPENYQIVLRERAKSKSELREKVIYLIKKGDADIDKNLKETLKQLL